MPVIYDTNWHVIGALFKPRINQIWSMPIPLHICLPELRGIFMPAVCYLLFRVAMATYRLQIKLIIRWLDTQSVFTRIIFDRIVYATLHN